MEIPPAADSHVLIGVEELCQSPGELAGPCEIGNFTSFQLFEFIQNRHAVRHSPQIYHSQSPCEEPESSLAPKHSAAPSESASLLLADTSMLAETTSIHALPSTETAIVECRNTVDILNVEADTPSFGKIIYFLAVCLFLTVYRRA